jgi:small ligand-binding sensory domain FIST
MIRAGVGQSQKQLTGQAVEEAACQAMARAGISRADLALIFFTAEHAARASELVSALARSVGTDCVFGSSGAGIVTGEGEVEGSSGWPCS